MDQASGCNEKCSTKGRDFGRVRKVVRRSSREIYEEEEQTETVRLGPGVLIESTHMTTKHDHCTPTWATPSRPAKQANPLTSLQQSRSALLVGRTRMFAKAQVPDVVPSRTKYGESPNDVRRLMIRMCCGR